MKKPKKRKSLVGKFFAVLFSILFVYFAAFAGYIAYTYLNENEEDDYFTANADLIKSILPEVPERTNFLLLGVDEDATRTDTIMVASFNSVSKEISLISIPRDTLVQVPDERWQIMCDNIGDLNRNGTRETKINAIHAYGGEEHGVEFLELQLEEMLDIEIDYNAKVSCEAFRYIVDSVGGIEYNVPMRMKYYDPTQDLNINLQPGLQTLDGDKAEQLVRFRYGYTRQDLDRVETQQNFMKVLISTILDKENIKSNPTAYLNTVIKYVDTNAKVTDLIKYIPYVSDLSGSNIKGYTLPGSPKNIGGGSYFVMDEVESSVMVYDIFKKPSLTPEEKEKESQEVKESFDKEIQILNGGYTSGLAGIKQKMLEELGYSVPSISDYDGEKHENTFIFVNEEGYGKDLVKYFYKAEVVVDSSQTGQYDIVVVLGTEETKEMPNLENE